MGFAKELNDVIFITVSLTPSLQRFFNTHVSGASEVNTMLSLDCIDSVSSSVDSHVSTRKTQVSISKTHSNFYRVSTLISIKLNVDFQKNLNYRIDNLSLSRNKLQHHNRLVY